MNAIKKLSNGQRPNTKKPQGPVPQRAPLNPNGGMPAIYGNDIKEELIRRLEGGEALQTICKDEHMPSAALWGYWCRTDPELKKIDETLRPIRARALFERGLGEIDKVADRESAYMSRVKSDIAFKAAALLDPQRWSDKTHSNAHRMAGGTSINLQINIGDGTVAQAEIVDDNAT